MNEKKKFRFNILDVIIILVVVSCIVGVAVRYSLPSKLGIILGGEEALIAATDEAVVTFYLENVRKEITQNSMVEGDKYYSKKHKCELGELYNVSEFIYEPYGMYRANEDGVPTYSELEYRCNVTGYLKVRGTVDPEKGFLVNNTDRLAPGERIDINSINRRMTVTILSIEIVE